MQGNSIKEREMEAEKKHVQVVKASPVSKSKSKRAFSEIIAEDWPDLKEYIVREVLIPALKDGILSIVQTALYGRSSPRSNVRISNRPRPTYSNPSYNVPYETTSYRTPVVSDGLAANIPYEFKMATRADADEIIYLLRDDIARYGKATLGALYDIVGYSTDNYVVTNKYGWTNLDGAQVKQYQGEYIVKLPRPYQLV